MKNDILNDKEYIDSINCLLYDIVKDYAKHITNIDLREYMKLNIKESTIQYCIKRTQHKSNEFEDLEKQLNTLDKIIAETTSKETVLMKAELKMKLDNLY